MELQVAQEKARAICRKYALDAEVFARVDVGGSIIVHIIDPSKPDRSAIDCPKERLLRIESELKNEILDCEVYVGSL
jgi:hypothetical protein